MSIRPLRTEAATTPRTQGERIRFARLSMELSQEAFGERVRQAGGGKVSKSLVSQWERDGVKNPNNANILAIQAVTGFRAEWIVRGREPKKATVDTGGARLDSAAMLRAVDAALKALKAKDLDARRAAPIIGKLYDTVLDSPDIDHATLAIVASALARP